MSTIHHIHPLHFTPHHPHTFVGRGETSDGGAEEENGRRTKGAREGTEKGSESTPGRYIEQKGPD